MKVIKHTKKGNICFVSHIDCMRVLQRTLARGRISTKMSEGFNPHPITFTSHPLPLGVQSEGEYFVVSNDDMTAAEVLSAFNAGAPRGIEGLSCIDVIKNPNFAKHVNYCEYLFVGDFMSRAAEIEKLTAEKSWVIEFDSKGSVKQQDIAPMIYQINVTERGIVAVLQSGNPNLRPDRFADALCAKFALKIGANDIVRTKQLVIDGQKIMTADEFCEGYIK